MPKKQLDYDQELRGLHARLERAAERCPEARQKELLAEAANTVAKTIDADIGDDKKAALLKTGSTLLRSVRLKCIRQSKPTVDKCGCLAAQVAGVSSAMRWSGAFASPGRMAAR